MQRASPWPGVESLRILFQPPLLSLPDNSGNSVQEIRAGSF